VNRPAPEHVIDVPALAPEVRTASAPVGIAERLAAVAREHPHAIAAVRPCGRDRRGRARYEHYTYAQLEHEAELLARGLAELGIERGVRAAFLVEPSLDFFALAFAVLKLGAVPVVIDPGIGWRRFKACLAKARPSVFIGVPRAQLARVVLGWGRGSVVTSITTGRRAVAADVTLARLRATGAAASRRAATLLEPDDVAAISFTSGSTGPPKGVVYRQRNFDALLTALQSIYDWRPGVADLPTMPLFALFGAASGVTVVSPEMDVSRPAAADPVKIATAIEDFGVATMFGSPALLNTLSRWAEQHDAKLPSLRRVVTAGAPVSAELMRRAERMLDEAAEIVTPYGATEALPVTQISHREVLGETAAKTDEGAGVCVGRPIAGVDLRIIGLSDEPIPFWDDELVVPDGELGEIVVCGQQVTDSYFDDDANTALAKIEVPGGTFFHRMGDVGYRDGDGRIWFCGRKSQRVVTARETLFTIPCEAVFNAHPAVFRTALVGPEVDGRVTPAICVELEPTARDADRARLRSELCDLGSRHPHTESIGHFLFHRGFPVDIRHNAKINREQLARWAASRVARD
jgi:acyl-CoA synthetase (AMP-forming)/AMP-acid ligase II